MDHELKKIGNKISSRRRELGITQSKLAEKINISNTHLSNIERGKKAPGFELFLDICKELKINSDYFISGKIYPSLDEELVDKIKRCSDENKIIINKIVDIFLQ